MRLSKSLEGPADEKQSLRRAPLRSPLFAALLAALIVLSGCPLSPGDNTGGDTTPPVFGGIVSILGNGMTRAVLQWTAATDNATAQADMVYLIFMATLADPPTTAEPAFTTSPGATSFEVTGLPVFQTMHFLVKAKDAEGNVDANTLVKTVSLTDVEWSFVDGASSGGISDGTSVGSTALSVAGGSLYALWTENDGGMYARAKVYNGNDGATVWTAVDDGPGIGLNYAAGAQNGPDQVSLATFGGRLYAAWPEIGIDEAYMIRVAAYDPADTGAGWKFVEGLEDEADGLNKDTTWHAGNPALVVAGDVLQALWVEQYYDGMTTANQIRAAEFNGSVTSPSWTFIDGNGPAGLNVDTAEDALGPAAAYLDGHTVAVWSEDRPLRARAYDGSTWSTIDGGGLNYDLLQNTGDPSLRVVGGRLYAAWEESTGSLVTQIRVAVFSGDFGSPSWVFVDGGGATGVNVDPANHAGDPYLVDLNGGLVLFLWQSDSGTRNVIRARAFNGVPLDPAWLTIDGGAPNGLNYSTATYSAQTVAAVELDDKLYATWAEETGVAGGATRVIVGR